MGDCIVETIPAVTAMATDSSWNKPYCDEYNLYVDQQQVAGDIVLWCHPAWLNTNAKSIQITAATEWVFHNRIWMAIDRTTVAEVVGSVRGVIPNSKLASYGDFSYDLDIETMYDNLDEKETKISHETQNVCREDVFDDSSYSPRGGEFSVNKETGSFLQINRPSFSSVRELVKQMKSESKLGNYVRPQSNIIDQWLLKWKAFLKSLMIAVGEGDPWTDALLKVCCRFLTAARDNQSLMLLMEAEMPLITDYKQLYTDPIALVELLSLPQPFLEDNQDLVNTQCDILWLRLSSSNVRELWSKKTEKKEISNMVHPFVGFSDASVGATNFLRRRKTKIAANVCDKLEIPEDEANHLLGSLINAMEGFNCDMRTLETAVNKFSVTKDTNLKNVLHDIHEKWTKMLFPSDKSIDDSTVNTRKTQTKIENSEQILCKNTSAMSVPPNNLSASLPNLSVPSTNLAVPPTNLSVTPTNFPVIPTGLPVPPTKLSVTPTNLPVQPTKFPVIPTSLPAPLTNFPATQIKLPVPSSNLPVPPPNLNLPVPPPNLPVPPPNLHVPPPNLLVPPPNLHAPPTNLPLHLPKLVLSKSNLTVPSSKSTAVFQPSNFISKTVPSPLPVYYMPVSHYVNREGKYYNKFRRKLPQDTSSNLGMTQKASELPFHLPNIPMHSSFPSEHWMIIRNCLPVSNPFQAAASLKNPRQINCPFNFQQSMIIPMAQIQTPQIQRQMPLKLEKNNSIPTEYFLKEINKNRILQNISNKIPNAKSRNESIKTNPFPLYYQSMDNFIQPVTKQNASMNSSSMSNLNNSMHRKLLNKYFGEGQPTYPATKDSKDLSIVPGLKTSIVNPLCQREGLMPKKFEFENEKRLQFNNKNKLKTAIEPKNKCSPVDSKNKGRSEVECRYFTQKWFSENQKVYKTKFCNAFPQNDLRIINHTKGKCKSKGLKEQGPTKQKFRKQKLLPTLLIRTCNTKILIRKQQSLNGFNIFTKYQSRNFQKCNALKEHKRMHETLDYSEINTKQNNLNDSFFAKVSECHLNEEDKYAWPITVEYLKDVADHLLCDECDRDLILNSECEKIDGFTHFKITILEILRRSSLMLNTKNS